MLLNARTLVFLWDPCLPNFAAQFFLLPQKLQDFPEGARKMQLVSVHPV